MELKILLGLRNDILILITLLNLFFLTGGSIVIGLPTSELISKLTNYSFLNWENPCCNDNILRFGMPQQIMMRCGIDRFYDSWGYESVQNPNSEIVISPRKWLLLENEFFDWLENAKELLFPTGSSIVTPNLTTWWFPSEKYPPKWTSRNKWKKIDFDSYENLLSKADVLNLEPVSLREDYRGGIVENYVEFKILGKIAVKNQPLYFFANEDRVIILTEYLSIILVLENQKLYQYLKNTLIKKLNPQLL